MTEIHEETPAAAESSGHVAAIAALPPESQIRATFQAYVQLPRPVLLLCLGSFINRAGSFVMLFMTIYVSKHLGYGVVFAADCFFAFGVGSIIASLVGGQLADHFGRRPIMLLALFGGAVTLGLMAIVQSRWGILGLMFCCSLLADMYRPAATAMVGDLVDSVQRPKAFGLMYIAFNLGFAVAAPVGGFLADYSFRWLFIGDALTTAIYGLMIVVLIRETLPRQSTSRDKGKKGNQVGWWEAICHISGDTTFLLFALAALLTSVVFMQGFSTLPIHLQEIGFTPDQIGWFMSVNGFLIVLLQVPITAMLDRFQRVLVILAGEVLIAIGFGLTTFALAWPLVATTVVVWTLGEVVQAAFKQSMVADLAPVTMRGRYMGIFALCHAIGLTFGVPLGGRILERYGAGVLWPFCFACASMACLVYVILYLRSRPRAA